MTAPKRWQGLFASERQWRSEDVEGVRDLREEHLGRAFVAVDGGLSGAAIVVRPWKRWPGKPYVVRAIAAPGALFDLGQAAAEVDAAVIVAESGYLNVRQPNSITTARACGIAIGAIAAHSGKPCHVVHVPPATWQAWALDLSTGAERAERKAAAIAEAESQIDLSGYTAEQRSAVGDAWGIATWWATAPMAQSPIRRTR